MKKKLCITFITLIFLGLFFRLFDNYSLSSSSLNKLRKKYRVPCAVIACINGNSTEYYFLGHSNIKSKIRPNSETIFQLGSIAKPISALAAFKLLKKHNLETNCPVTNFLSLNLKHPQQLTFEKILSHSSGLKHLISNGVKDETNVAKKIRLNDLKTFKNPNNKFLYTAAGYYLLELLFKEIEGENASEYIKKSILNPLGLTQTDLNWTSSSKCAKGYTLYNKEVKNLYYPEKCAGSLASNITDMSNFVESFWTGKLVDLVGLDYYKKIMAPHANDYYLGFGIEKEPGGLYLSHHGTNRGWNAFFGIYPKSKKGIVILTNSDWGLVFIEKVQNIWKKTTISSFNKPFYTKPALAIDIGILAAYICSVYLLFFWKPRRRRAKYRSFGAIFLLSMWVIAFYSPLLLIRGWVLAPYFPWRFNYLTAFIMFISLTIILKSPIYNYFFLRINRSSSE